jgi:hypothetical protein
MREEQDGSIGTMPEGREVLQEVVRMTGLPEESLDSALSELLGKPGASVNELTMNELRSLLIECLESINQQMSIETDGTSDSDPGIN